MTSKQDQAWALFRWGTRISCRRQGIPFDEDKLHRLIYSPEFAVLLEGSDEEKLCEAIDAAMKT